MKSILITGGSGFIGSHTSLVLLEKGYKIFLLDSFVNSSAKSIDKIILILEKKGINVKNKIHFIKGDLKNKNDVKRIFKIS